mmetsp:Transcript_56474/g.168974  ORF Transcript_56474/g.168974 Transcript_56474/m.168974 type:complete len:91 (-) Transcript_56474:168-440(-)
MKCRDGRPGARMPASKADGNDDTGGGAPLPEPKLIKLGPDKKRPGCQQSLSLGFPARRQTSPAARLNASGVFVARLRKRSSSMRRVSITP